MFFAQTGLKHISTITHEGKVVLFGTLDDGRVLYTVRQDGYEDSYNPALGWEDWQPLAFPDEADDASVLARDAREHTVEAGFKPRSGSPFRPGDALLRCVYRSSSLGAPAPVQLISGIGHLYVFRQSTRQTVLVDRFVLDGMTNRLVRKLEVRFKRSRQKFTPLQRTSGSTLTQIDSLDFRDSDGAPFYEPTTELGLLGPVDDGRFAVVLTPTTEHDHHRWHFFICRDHGALEAITLLASSEGLFALSDYTVLDPADERGTLTPRSIAGITRRSFTLENRSFAGAPAATRYDVQFERATRAGLQLLRESTRIMVATPTSDGQTATLDFGVTADGMLSDTAGAAQQPPEDLRSTAREMLLPLDTLEAVKSYGLQKPPPDGTISGLERGPDDRVYVRSAKVPQLKIGSTVAISGTRHYNGRFAVRQVNGDTFAIDAPWLGDDLGRWELLPEETTGLTFDGMVTAVRQGDNGRLLISAPNHGLANGDEVQIVDSTDYDGSFTVTRIDDVHFAINAPWLPAEAVNLKLISRRRRGISFDGNDDWLDLPALAVPAPSAAVPFGQTYALWLAIDAIRPGRQMVLADRARQISEEQRLNRRRSELEATLSDLEYIHARLARLEQQVSGLAQQSAGAEQHYAGLLADPAHGWQRLHVTSGDQALMVVAGTDMLALGAPPADEPTPDAYAWMVEQDAKSGHLRIRSGVGDRWLTVTSAAAPPEEAAQPAPEEAGGAQPDEAAPPAEQEPYLTLNVAERRDDDTQEWILRSIDGALVLEHALHNVTLDVHDGALALTPGDANDQTWNWRPIGRPASDQALQIQAVVEPLRRERAALEEEYAKRSAALQATEQPLRGELAATNAELERLATSLNPGRYVQLFLEDGKPGAQVNLAGESLSVIDANPLVGGEWAHIAAVIDYAPQIEALRLSVLRDGKPAATGMLRRFAHASLITPTSTPIDVSDDRNLTLFSNRDFTIAAWVNPNSLGGNSTKRQPILGQRFGTDVVFGQAEGGRLFLAIDETREKSPTSSFGVQTGRWQHVAVVYRHGEKAGTASFFINGMPAGEGEVKDTTLEKIDRLLYVGYEERTKMRFDGWIAETAVWGHARSAEQIAADALRALQPNEAGLGHYWSAAQAPASANGVAPAPEAASGRVSAATEWTAAFVAGGPGTLGLVPGDDTRAGPGFVGRMAELQIWDRAQSADEVRNSMALPLTGRETGLAGYWRLGAISAAAPRTTPDFSPNGNDAVVHGDPYVSAARFARKLGDGRTDAVRYANDDLFAVTQRARYIERFEFRAVGGEPIDDPMQVGPRKQPIFQFAHWGKRSRGARTTTTIPSETNFAQGEGGWWEASSTFVVPDDVNLVRAFGIDAVAGAWQSLEIRKHRIVMVSDAITAAGADAKPAPTPVADNFAGLDERLDTLAASEREEGRLYARRRELRTLLAAPEALKNLIEDQQKLVTQLANAANALWNVYVQERDDLFNYWCTLNVHSRPHGAARVYTHTHDLIHGNESPLNAQSLPHENYRFKFARVKEGEEWYTIVCMWGDRILDVNYRKEFNVYGHDHHHKETNQQWSFTADPNGWYTIRSRFGGMALDQHHENNVAVTLFHNGSSQRWSIKKVLDPLKKWASNAISGGPAYYGEPSNTKIADAYSQWKQKDDERAAAQALLDQYMSAEHASKAERDGWRAELDRIDARLIVLQGEMLTTHSVVLNEIKRARTDATVGSSNEPPGLVTRTALLGFARPASRLTLFESGEGNLLLSYFDTRGRVRQSVYDAAADSSRNNTFEQWLPDGTRTCLALSQSDSAIRLATPVPLGPSWTLETWFQWPLPELPHPANTLFAGAADQHVIVALSNRAGEQHAGQLGVQIDGAFHFSGYDFAVAPLADGWHHLAAVGGMRGKPGDEEVTPITSFYIDGKHVGEVGVRSSDPLSVIGNHPTGGQPFGKLAEIRLWNVALSPEEIEANSLLALSGAEPGLVAYYPLDEVRDQEGAALINLVTEGPAATSHKAGWAACTATLRPKLIAADVVRVSKPAEYVGFGAFSKPMTGFPLISAATLAAGFTLEFWCNGSTLDWAVSLNFRNSCLVAGQGNTHSLYRVWRMPRGQGPLPKASRRNAASGLHWPRNDPSLQTVPLATLAAGTLDDGNWHHVTLTWSPTDGLSSYRDGEMVEQVENGAMNWSRDLLSLTIGGGKTVGSFADLRLWKGVRSQEQIKADRTRRLTGREPGLGLYLPLDRVATADGAHTVLDLVSGRVGHVSNATTISAPDLALSLIGDNLVVAEYSTIGVDPATQQRTAILRRFIGCATWGGAHLISQKRVEQLELRWIGNAQFEPTLLGYIEGAPPLPSENLTVDDNLDYNGATSVALSMSDDVEFSWNREQEVSTGATAELFAGLDSEMKLVVGGVVTKDALNIRKGFLATLNLNYDFLNSTTVSTTSGSEVVDRLELRGAPESTAQFPAVGRRFVPKNVGYALVVSGLADVFISRLARSKRMIGYQVQPNEQFGLDINTITFLMNPAYTMAGSLDGLTGSAAASERFYRHVPQMRAQYGSQYPASYYRLKEAYDLKRQIEQQDADRETYFKNFDSVLVDAISLDREIGDDETTSVALGRAEDGGSQFGNLSDSAEQAKLQADLDTQRSEAKKIGAQKQLEIEAQISSLEKQVNAAAKYAYWQKRMEDLQIRAGKRNIVNTYVWDADGGLRVESQQFASTIEHSIGGSFTMEAAIGGQGGFQAFGAGFDLTVQGTFRLTQIMNKTEARTRGFALDVDLSGVESIGVTDANDYPLIPGEKVDRYRFMSFYLDGSTSHFHDFFNYVVDPEWLASNDEEARALRQTMAGKANKSWRVLHRVTYVERPALLGFGRDARRQADTLTTPWWYQSYVSLNDMQAKVDRLQRDNAELKSKLDQILLALNGRAVAGD